MLHHTGDLDAERVCPPPVNGSGLTSRRGFVADQRHNLTKEQAMRALISTRTPIQSLKFKGDRVVIEVLVEDLIVGAANGPIRMGARDDLPRWY